jgi:hypothetical protein
MYGNVCRYRYGSRRPSATYSRLEQGGGGGARLSVRDFPSASSPFWFACSGQVAGSLAASSRQWAGWNCQLGKSLLLYARRPRHAQVPLGRGRDAKEPAPCGKGTSCAGPRGLRDRSDFAHHKVRNGEWLHSEPARCDRACALPFSGLFHVPVSHQDRVHA